MKRGLIGLLVLFLGWVSLGCAPAISERVQAQADHHLAFPDILADPAKYQGKLVILGGEVANVTTTADGGTLIMVNERELDRDLRPVRSNVDGGTFYVKSKEWLEPDRYMRDRKITVAGFVTKPEGRFPVIEAKRIHLWEHPYHVTTAPKSWFTNDPEMQYWFSSPYFNPSHKGEF